MTKLSTAKANSLELRNDGHNYINAATRPNTEVWPGSWIKVPVGIYYLHTRKNKDT